MHTVEIDQSGRIDQTDRPTVLALADGTSYSIYLSSKTKRECLIRLREQHRFQSSKKLYVLLFATLLYFLLIDKIAELDLAIVDTELLGLDAQIKEHTINLLRRKGVSVYPDMLTFRQIGKNSPAHHLAWRVFRGLAQPDKVLTAIEILAELGK